MSWRYQLIEACVCPEDIRGFLVRGDRDEAHDTMLRLLREWPGDVVDLGGRKVPASCVDPRTIVIRHEADYRGVGPGSGKRRFAVDGSLVDGHD